MTLVKVSRNNGFINVIEVSGHAGAADPGEDMVCSAISAFSFMTANNITKFNKDNFVNITIDDGYFKCEVLNTDDVVETLLTSYEEHLSEVQKQYPKYIKFKGE
jgi:uncharacterized protein YsxB (DUF464 family)